MLEQDPNFSAHVAKHLWSKMTTDHLADAYLARHGVTTWSGTSWGDAPLPYEVDAITGVERLDTDLVGRV